MPSSFCFCYKESFGVDLPEEKKSSEELKKICKNPEETMKERKKEKFGENEKKYSAWYKCSWKSKLDEMKKINPDSTEKELMEKYYDALEEVI